MCQTLLAAMVAVMAGGVNLMASGQETLGRIVVTAEGFRNTKGKAHFALYRQGEKWLKPDEAFRSQIIEIGGDVVKVTLDQVPYDTYAVNVIHDENENGKLDMRWFPWPKPKEGAGVSNNRLGAGPPSYDKAKFELSEPSVEIRIELQY